MNTKTNYSEVINSIDGLSFAIAKKLSILHEAGSTHSFQFAVKKDGTRDKRKKSKERTAKDATGAGIPLSQDDLEELRASARCALIACTFGNGATEFFGETYIFPLVDHAERWKFAASFARKQLYQRTKCPTFKSFRGSQNAHLKAEAEAWDYYYDSGLLRFQLEKFHEETAPDFAKEKRNFAIFKHGRNKLISYHKQSRKRQWKSALKNDIALLRESIGKVQDGTAFHVKQREDSAKYHSFRRLIERIQSA